MEKQRGSRQRGEEEKRRSEKIREEKETVGGETIFRDGIQFLVVIFHVSNLEYIFYIIILYILFIILLIFIYIYYIITSLNFFLSVTFRNLPVTFLGSLRYSNSSAEARKLEILKFQLPSLRYSYSNSSSKSSPEA